jgi:DNA-binding transcriptional LysR family regulator
MSQPPLTRQIRQLELELGVTLFVRHRTGVEMTSEGRALLDSARAVTAAIGHFVNTAQDLCEERAGPLSRQQIDVAVMRPPVDGQLVSEPLFEERFVALLGDSHPLASRASVTLQDLASEPLLLYDRSVGPAVYDKTLAMWETAGIKPLVVEKQPPPYSQGAMMLVASRQGYYLGIASPYTQSHRASGVAVVPLDEPDARIDVLIVWRRNDASIPIREFLRSAREVFPLKSHASRSRKRSA